MLFSKKRINYFCQIIFGYRDFFLIQDGSCHILGICFNSQAENCLIGFFFFREKLYQPGGFTQNNWKYSFCFRIQSTCMTDFFHVKNSAKFCNYIMRCVAFFLADDQNSVHYASPISHICFSICAVILLITSYIDP